MSPPIYTPDGSEVSEIVLPDGSTASEVIGPDGTVVFEAGPDIPDSDLDYLWYAPDVSSISPWTDSIVEVDASVSNGDPSLNEGINGNQSVLYDDANTEWHTIGQSLEAGPNAEHTFVAVIKTDDTSVNQVVLNNGQGPGTDGYRWFIGDGGTWGFISNGQQGVESGTTVTTDAYVVVGTYDGSNVILDANGSEELNKSVPTPNNPTTKASIAAHPAPATFFSGDIAAVGHESGFGDAARRDDLMQDFADAFDITI